MSIDNILKLIRDHNIKFIDLRFCDTRGKEHHLTIPAARLSPSLFEEGKVFDGSSITGWKDINDSDMILLPDPESAVIDPFYEEPTLILRCDITEPGKSQGYEHDPRSLSKRAERYLIETGIADNAYFGPENEFFIFDAVRWSTGISGSFCEIDSVEGAWNSDKIYDNGNKGHRPTVKGGYFPVPPVDSLQNIRSEICHVLEEMSIETEVHHHEVATAGQCEIGVKFNTLVKKADEVLVLKYVVANIAHAHNKTATFMPKPLTDDNANGMHVHQSLSKNGQNLFAGNLYGGLSQTALYYIGGILKHAKALNAFTNASTNSYRRLIPGFEAPVILAYSANNRSASIRIPYTANPKERRIEVRFPDSTANPYLAFSAMLMAGLDGIQNKIDPGKAVDKNLYDLPPDEENTLILGCQSLSEALEALKTDREFLTRGGVFSDSNIDRYIQIKMKEITKLQRITHPGEFEMYYSL